MSDKYNHNKSNEVPKMNKAVIYSRVSTAEQAEKKKSLDSQEQYCRDFATKRDIEIDRVFREEGESAKTADRTQLIKLIEYCKTNKGKLRYVIVWKVDRFARRTEDHLALKALLLKLGIQLLSATEPIENSNTGKLMETILAGFAEFDNDVRSERCSNGMKARLEEGGWVHVAPIGYRNYKDSLRRPTLKPDESSVKVAAFLREFCKGLYTQKQAVQLAHQFGVRTKNNKPMSANGVYKMLRNPVYAGLITGKMLEHSVKGLHEPLITEDEFNTIAQILEGKRKTIRPETRGRPDWPLRRLLLCDKCRHPLTGSASKGRTKHYPKYHCTQCRGGGMSADREKVHGEFQALLERVKPSPYTLKLFKEIVMRRWHLEHLEAQSKRRKIDEEIKTLEDRRQTVIDKNLDGAIDDEMMREQVERIGVRTAELRLTRSDIMEGELEKEIVVDTAIGFISDAGSFWRNANIDNKQRFQRMIFPEGISYKFANGFGTAVMGACYEELNLIEAEITRHAESKKPQHEAESLLVVPRGFEPLISSVRGRHPNR